MKYLPKMSKESLLKITNGYTMEQIEAMYIEENYSMELVSRITAINMSLLSRILWDYGLPQKKEAVNGMRGEINNLERRVSVPISKDTDDDELWKDFD